MGMMIRVEIDGMEREVRRVSLMKMKQAGGEEQRHEPEKEGGAGAEWALIM